MDNDLSKSAQRHGGRRLLCDARWLRAEEGSQHVNFIDEDGHVHELYRSPHPAAQWVDNDLTKLAGRRPPEFSLDGYPQGDGSQHVNFIDVDGFVHELYHAVLAAPSS